MMGCSHHSVNHLTHIAVISVMIQRMDDPGHGSPGAGPGDLCVDVGGGDHGRDVLTCIVDRYNVPYSK